MGGKRVGGGRVGRALALMAFDVVKGEAANIDPSATLYVAGSVRRGLEVVGDLDVVVAAGDLEAACLLLEQLPGIMEVDTHQIQVDYIPAWPESLGAALMHSTGPVGLNIVQRRAAKAEGLKLNQYGLFRNGVRIAGRSEWQIYQKLGLTWKEPQCRE